MTLFGFRPRLLRSRPARAPDAAGSHGVPLGGERPLRFASLLRRGIANGIDHSAVWIVMIAEWRRILRSPQDVSMMLAQMGGGVVVVVGSVIGTLLVTSFMEGRWGTTPGKWLLGIRVVDVGGNVCGFWRALLQGALRMVDGSAGLFCGHLRGRLSPPTGSESETWRRRPSSSGSRHEARLLGTRCRDYSSSLRRIRCRSSSVLNGFSRTSAPGGRRDR